MPRGGGAIVFDGATQFKTARDLLRVISLNAAAKRKVRRAAKNEIETFIGLDDANIPKVSLPDLTSFHKYISTSGAEFSVAQQMYVDTNSGWFSDRSVRYLAAGKPVLVQDTGFSRNYPVGAGLLTFSTFAQAVDGVRKIVEDYSEHARAARQIAEEYFDSDRVLGELLSQVL